MPRANPGPSRLSGILAHLTRQPRLELTSELTKLRVAYRYKNARPSDFGARYFVKEELPRIRYANPTLPIEVDKLIPSPKDKSVKSSSSKNKKPSLVLEYTNSKPKEIPLSEKWSTEIINDLMSIAGSPSIWPQWVKEKTSKGESVYVDRYGNGRGKEGYVRRPRESVSWHGWKKVRVKAKVEESASLKTGEKKVEEVKTAEKIDGHDELKDLLGLGTMPTETGPPKAGISAALP